MQKDQNLLTDAQWARLSPLLPGQEHSPGTTAKDTRLFVEAVLWRGRRGVSWRNLPAERFGPWYTVYTRFRRWQQAGVWPQALAQLQDHRGLHRLLAVSTAGPARFVAAAKKKIAPSGNHPVAAGRPRAHQPGPACAAPASDAPEKALFDKKTLIFYYPQSFAAPTFTQTQ